MYQIKYSRSLVLRPSHTAVSSTQSRPALFDIAAEKVAVPKKALNIRRANINLYLLSCHLRRFLIIMLDLLLHNGLHEYISTPNLAFPAQQVRQRPVLLILLPADYAQIPVLPAPSSRRRVRHMRGPGERCELRQPEIRELVFVKEPYKTQVAGDIRQQDCAVMKIIWPGCLGTKGVTYGFVLWLVGLAALWATISHVTTDAV